MTSEETVSRALAWFDSGAFRDVLTQRVAIHSESQRDDRNEELERYYTQALTPDLIAMGFVVKMLENPVRANRPFLLATRIEDPALPTMLSYGHGDVVFGSDESWSKGLSPWTLTERDGRWYGRGSADNKGQHSINLAALEQVWRSRGGKLGFNCKLLFELGEEISSPGLAEICEQHKEELSADVFIASDGPRLNERRPTLFLGSRGCINFRLSVHARDSDYHSGNWGGLLSNPGTVLANAIASLVNARGELQVSALLAPPLTPALRHILSDIVPGGNPDDPALSENWGERDMSAAQRLFAANTLEVLAFLTGNPAQPMNAIPGHASAVCQLRFVVGTDWTRLAEHVRAHLDSHGFETVEIDNVRGTPATRFDPSDPLVDWVMDIMREMSPHAPALLPNLGGSLPNDVFADTLGLPTLWIPHSYPACGQHAADEHLPVALAREGLAIMTRLFWDLGQRGQALIARHRAHGGEQ